MLTSGVIAGSSRRMLARSAEAIRISAGLEAEVVQLFEQLRNPLLRYLVSFSIVPCDAEEIVQESFLALFRHLQQGRPRENLPGWLFRVAHNLALKNRNRARFDAARFSSEPLDREQTVTREPGPEDCVLASELQTRLQAAILALPPQDRFCLMLRAEGLRYREIAGVLGIALGSVAGSLGRSLARLKRVADA